MKLSFRNQILVTIAISCVICTASAVFFARQKIVSTGERGLVEKSRAILSRLEVGRDYVSDMNTLDGVIQETLQKFPDGNLSEEQKMKVLKSVPVFAAFRLGMIGAEKENYSFRVASATPRSSKNQATPEELVWIREFEKDTAKTEIVSVLADRESMVVSRPVRISKAQGCLSCHGHPSTSPWKNGKDILGYAMEDLKDGELRGIFSVVSSIKPVEAETRAATWNILAWGSLFTVIALLLGYRLVRDPISRLTEVSEKLAEAEKELSVASSQIATVSDTLSMTAAGSAQSIQETAASVEQMSSMISKNADNSRRSREVSEDSSKNAGRGKEVISEMMESIDQISISNRDISEAVSESNRRVSEMVGVIGQIAEKTKLIDDIVFQTKLLSFNASVEAARAGEHGRGFAVVAEEVGQLAAMSGKASQEISTMLKESALKVEAVVNETRSKVEPLIGAGKEKVENGNVTARRCGEVLEQIVLGVNQVGSMVQEISAATSEQANGIQEINKAMGLLDQSTQKNAGVSDSAAHAAKSLQEQATKIRSMVRSLITTVHGEKRDDDQKKAA